MDIVSVVCPHCFLRNRVPETRMAESPKCGSCHEPLFQGKPTPVNAEQLHKMLRGNDIPVVVDYWAPWCGPCRTFAPTFVEAAKNLEPAVRLLKFNTETNQELAAAHSIRSIPTLILFQNGKEVRRLSGALPLPGFLNWIGQLV